MNPITIFLILVLIWLVFGLIGSNMAKARGRDAGAGCCGGFIFGPLTVIYYIIAGDSEHKRMEMYKKANKKADDN
jgi:hypothetical protein